MKSSFQRLLAAVPALALLPTGALANPADLNLEGVNKYVSTQGQSTSIRQFSDVYPTDWAYQALSKLVETYGCVSGFPDGTFRGNEPVTRFQMAALLAGCLEKVSMSGMEMSDEMKALVASLETELITVQGEVDSLKAKVTELEGMDYSPAVKVSLSAQYDYLMAGSGDDDAKVNGRRQNDTSGIATGHSASIEFSGSTNGADKLTLSVEYEQLPSFGDYFADGYFTYGNTLGEGQLEVDDLIYSYPLHLGATKAKIYTGTINDGNVLEGTDTYYGGSGHDDYGVGSEGSGGVGISIPLFGDATFSVAYTVGDATASLADDQGFFGEDSPRFISTALSWRGEGVMGNEAFITGWYRNETNTSLPGFLGRRLGSFYEQAFNQLTPGDQQILIAEDPNFAPDIARDLFTDNIPSLNANRFTLAGGLYLTEDLSFSGTYSWAGYDGDAFLSEEDGFDFNTNKWMFAVNMDNALFEGNSAGLAYGTAEWDSDWSDDVPTVLEIYYTWKVNDHFEIPVYFDFINNNLGERDTGGWAFGVRPSFSF